eukprot:UN26305
MNPTKAPTTSIPTNNPTKTPTTSVPTLFPTMTPTKAPTDCWEYVDYLLLHSTDNLELCEHASQALVDDIDLLNDQLEDLLDKQNAGQPYPYCDELEDQLDDVKKALDETAGKDTWETAVVGGGLACEYVPGIVCDKLDACEYEMTGP